IWKNGCEKESGSKKMGVNMNDQNMESIELLKEMELKKNEILQKKEEDNMTKKKRENIEKEKFLASIKKSETLGKSQKVKKGVAPLMRHMISQYKFHTTWWNIQILNRLLGGFGISLAGLGLESQRKLEEIEETDLLNSNQIEYRKNKAAGPDSIPAEFYQICWDIVKKDIVSLFQDFHAGHLDVSRLNYGIITLLPKNNEATKIQHEIFVINGDDDIKMHYANLFDCQMGTFPMIIFCEYYLWYMCSNVDIWLDRAKELYAEYIELQERHISA
ncbi:hypothetical protein ACJX0J_012097, partial [Zea mays]